MSSSIVTAETGSDLIPCAPSEQKSRNASANASKSFLKATFFSASTYTAEDDISCQTSAPLKSKWRNTLEVGGSCSILFTELLLPCRHRSDNPWQVVGIVVRQNPVSCVVVPLLVLCVLVGLGVFGVLAGAANVATENQNTAYSIVKDTSMAFTLYIQRVSMASIVAWKG